MTHVWYAAYGSNLSRERFEVYLDGGRPRGAAHEYPGCRDATRPLEDHATEVEAELVFGGTSQTWGGGVGFVLPGPQTVKARLYLLTLEQVADVVAQENWLDPGTVSFDDATFEEPVVLTGHMYGIVLPLAARGDVPVLAVTQPADAIPARPSAPYLAHIADGLRDAHAMSDDEIVAYLTTKRGVRGRMTDEELSAAIGSS